MLLGWVVVIVGPVVGGATASYAWVVRRTAALLAEARVHSAVADVLALPLGVERSGCRLGSADDVGIAVGADAL